MTDLPAELPTPPRPRGRAPGAPKTPGSGRKKGVPNKISADLKDTIAKRGRPIELLCDVARGVKIRVGPQAGVGKAEYVYPSLPDRIVAARILSAKLLPDLKAQELTGRDGESLAPVQVNIPPSDVGLLYGNGKDERHLARAVAEVLSKARDASEGEDVTGAAGVGLPPAAPESPQSDPDKPPRPGETFPVGDGHRMHVKLQAVDDKGNETWAVVSAFTGEKLSFRHSRVDAEARALELLEQRKV